MRFSAKQFAAAGVHANARNWHSGGFTPAQAAEWEAAGYASSAEAYRWKYVMKMAAFNAETVPMALGIEPYPSNEWPSAAVAASYRDAGVDVGLAARWFLAGVEPEEAAVSERPAHWMFSAND